MMRNEREEEEVMELNDIDDFTPFDEWKESPNFFNNETESSTISKFSFRLGLELETGSLLPERVHDLNRFQKEPLLTFFKDEKKLFHVEIDGIDIEYVTVPFSNDEESDLQECISIIQKSSTILRDLVNTKDQQFTLRQWFEKLKEIGYNLQEEVLFKKVENEIISWKNGAQKWEGFFQPHATIQLPLDNLIEILFELFKNASGIISVFEAALPFHSVEDCTKYFNSDNSKRKLLRKVFNTKVDGLMFLQAQTFLNLTIPVFRCQNNSELCNNLLNDTIKFHQNCPKMFLHVMSRRPYSDMLNELKDNENLEYGKLFKSRMKNNLLFTNLDAFCNYYNRGTIENYDDTCNGVPENFKKANYADHYSSGEFENRKDLRNILKYEHFKEDEISEETLNNFLKRGIISTGMLRAMKKEALEHFNLDKVLKNLDYDTIINSIEKPEFKPIIKIRNDEIVVVENNEENDEFTPRDFISPLPASSPNGPGVDKRNCDSMGSYQFSADEINTSEFGEAIIEIRAISFAYHSELGNRIARNGDIMPNLFLSEIEYFEKDFLALFRLIKSQNWHN